MSISYAFELTPEDVSAALKSIGMEIDEDKADKLYGEHIIFEVERIEDAALMGDEMEEQLRYAYAEIIAILREENAI